MAFYTNTLKSRPRKSAIAAFLGGVAGFFDGISAAQNRSTTVQRMQDLSDRELANMGVSRADIVRYVYRDIYHI